MVLAVHGLATGAAELGRTRRRMRKMERRGRRVFIFFGGCMGVAVVCDSVGAASS